jgi:hypothetical protein
MESDANDPRRLKVADTWMAIAWYWDNTSLHRWSIARVRTLLLFSTVD